jgi:amino acid transporter
MFFALLITTVLYVMVSLVLTGMVSYDQLGVADPLAFVFTKLHLTKLSGIIAVSAVIAMASVLLVFQLGQPRIWMSMSRDGLLPPVFSKLHPRYRTPGFSTIVTGIIVALPSLFMNLTEVTDLTSIGTLFAFILVSGGILVLNPKGKRDGKKSGFVVPYLNSRYFMPPMMLLLFSLLMISNDGLPDLSKYLQTLSIHSLPYMLFALTTVVITILALVKSWSFIPVLGLLTNFYLMSELGIKNWSRFGIWLVIGLFLYFSYGIFHSKLSETKEVAK